MQLSSIPTFKMDPDEAHRHLAAIVESSDDAIISKTLDGVITSWNKAAERMFGYRAEEMLGQPISVLIPPENGDEMPRILGRLRNGEHIEQYVTSRRRKDGHTIRVALSISPVYDSEGRIIGAAKIARDITERALAQAEMARLLASEQLARAESERALRIHRDLEEKLASLVEVSGSLLGSLKSEEIIPRVIELANKLLVADAYAIWRTDGEKWRIVGSSGLSNEYAAQVISAGEVNIQLIGPISVGELRSIPELNSRKSLYEQEGIRAFLAAPMRIHGINSGTITFYFRQPHPSSETDLRIATALANLASAAISTAEMYESQLAQRARAEAGARRARLVARASEILGSSLDYESTLVNLAKLAVPDFADWCAVDLLTAEGSLNRLALYHTDPRKLELAHEVRRRYPDEAHPGGLEDVLRTGSSRIYPDVTSEMLASGATDSEHLELLRAIGIHSVIIVPMVARQKTLGVITFVISDPSRSFNDEDLNLAEQLATRGALAIDNARLLATAERERAEAQAAAAALGQSNAELEQFAYVSSHDLQEPLRNIASYAQLLRQRYQGRLDADADEFIEFLVDGARRMSCLIEDLLRYSRLTRAGAPKLLPVDCSRPLAVAIANLAKSIRETNATIEYGALPVVLGHEVQLSQVFQNLISNSIKYGGEKTPEIRISAQAEGDSYIISVADNGIGIDPRYKERIFGMFKRLHGRNVPGTGIGLATCRKIIEHHGGRIWVESEEGSGSTFYFTLKRAGAPPAQ